MEILPFVAIWMDLQIVILSEYSQSEKDKYHSNIYVWNQKKKGTNELIYKTEIELKMQKTNTVTWGKVERNKWEIGIDIYILLPVQVPSRIQLLVTPWNAAHQAPCASPSPKVCSSSCPLHQ